MSPTQKRRLTIIGVILAGLALTTILALNAFRNNLMYFVTPSDIRAGDIPASGLYRIGGMVVENSVRRTEQGVTILFDLTDYEEVVTVEYTGILPDLFREGQGIVANGSISPDGIFIADEVLAKHDENYMPPEVAAAMKKPESNAE
jgi:cytochrome c-type biogenesis protein CcmE